MSRDIKSIFKMQEAGSIPEVNQYGLTEEQMQSVRDNMSRYGLSEEDAVANKIRALEGSGGYLKKSAMVSDIMSNQGYLNSAVNNIKSKLSSYAVPHYKPKSFNPNDRVKDWGLINSDPNWRIKMLEQLNRNLNRNLNRTVPSFEDKQETTDVTAQNDSLLSQRSTTSVNTPNFEIQARERAKQNAIQQHNEAVEQYRKLPTVNVPEWFSLLLNTAPKETIMKGFSSLQENAPIHPFAKTFLNKLYTNYGKNLYEQKYNEYLNEHPIKPGTGIGYDPYIGIQHNPLVQRQQEAHNYAVKQSGYIGNNSTAPYREIDKTFGDIAIGTTALMPLIGASAGAFGTIPKIAADIKFGYDGAKALVSPNGVPKTWNFIKQGKYGRALRSGAWDLLDFGLAKQGVRGIKSFGNYAKDVANVAKFNIWNRPNKFKMEYPWQRTQEVLPDAIQSYSKPQSSYNVFAPMQLSALYKRGGVLKYQVGGLVYKPYFPETKTEPQTEETLSYEPYVAEEESFQVEPVKVYQQTSLQYAPVAIETVQEPTQEENTTDVSLEMTEGELNALYKDGSNEEKRKASIKYLQQQLDLTKEQAAAIVGQWQRESHFKLNAENKEEKEGKNSAVKSSQYGIGIGQWTGQRHDAFVRYVKSHGGIANLKTQLDFAIEEIKTNPDFLNNLRSAKTLNDASAYVYVQYVAGQQRGIKDLEDLYARVRFISNKYKKKHQELYGRYSDMFEIGLRNAEDSLKLN